MTGFGRGAAGAEPSRYEATAQGWNHRHADLVFRLPEALRQEERGFRQLVLEFVIRGRCEVSIRRVGADAGRPMRRLDRAAVEQFLRDAEPLRVAGAVSADWSLGELALSPFFESQELSAVSPEEDTAAGAGIASEALREALEALDSSRVQEGARLADVIGEGLEELTAVVRQLRARRAGTVVEFAAALRARLDEILPGGIDALPAERLGQEIVLLADRADVREELDRLDGHLEAAREILAGPGPHGRRMDFLVQELLREMNTIGSKSRDLDSAQLVIEAKVINERIREQIQNVE